MIFFPHAKINIGLNVLSKREDGYHEIETCIYPVPLHDVLEIFPSETLEFFSYGLPIEGSSENNLVLKAYHLVKEHFEIPAVQIHLLKNIPMGAGLGGGSSDASFMLIGLNELFNLDMDKEQLKELASQLGSECPFFIDDKPMMATGRGEILRPLHLDLSEYYLKLVYPDIHIGTKEAYDNVVLGKGTFVAEKLSSDKSTWQNNLHNSFEKSAFSNYPVLAEIKADLYGEGAIYAGMTGSGSCMFGIFSTRPQLTYPTHFERIFSL